MKLAVLVAFAAAYTTAFAQAHGTAEQGVRLQTYALASYVRPDFGGALRNGGGTVGIDLNFGSFAGRFSPSIDLRALGSGGRVSNQYLYGFGPRLVANFGRVQPYAEFVLGDGILHFPNPVVPTYTHDNCLARGFGGGADIVLSPAWAIRAEVLTQRWKLTEQSDPFYPLAASAGIRYQFHFRGRGGPGL